MDRNLRIAIITRTYPPKGGGIAAAHFNLARCLQTRHDVGVFAFDDDDKSPDENVTRAKTPPLQVWFMRRLARTWVRRHAKGENAINCERIFRIIPAIRRLNRALRSFRPDFILCQDNFVPALAIKKPPGGKLIWLAYHNYLRFEQNPIATKYSWIDLQLAHRLELRGFRKADAVVATSEYIADVTRQTLRPKGDVRVIRNYVDVEFLSELKSSTLKSRLGISQQATLIYIPSGGAAIKGERYTGEIIRRLAASGENAFFVSGAISPALRFELDHLPQEIIVHAPQSQTYAAHLADVAACDMTVSPTLIENLSSALIESLALGLPAISWDVGGNRELVQSGVNGYIVPYVDMESLIQRASELASSRELLASMKQASRSSVASILDPDRVLEEFDQLFEVIRMCRAN